MTICLAVSTAAPIIWIPGWSIVEVSDSGRYPTLFGISDAWWSFTIKDFAATRLRWVSFQFSNSWVGLMVKNSRKIKYGL